jgi:hypothetical protein
VRKSCPAYGRKCDNCGNLGHYRDFCWSKPRADVNVVSINAMGYEPETVNNVSARSVEDSVRDEMRYRGLAK